MELGLQEKWPSADQDEEFMPAGDGWRWDRSPSESPCFSHDDASTELKFGNWCLVPRARLLLRDGRPAELGSRAFDLLHLLLSRRGFVVEKSEIVSFVWPNTIVDESNLRFQVGALRKALGQDGALIKTIPGRGYIFIADYRIG
jgi:DNA-binding winged helix-turn-helix (wHTH) protein